jgi:hypothetical protein
LKCLMRLLENIFNSGQWFLNDIQAGWLSVEEDECSGPKMLNRFENWSMMTVSKQSMSWQTH